MAERARLLLWRRGRSAARGDQAREGGGEDGGNGHALHAHELVRPVCGNSVGSAVPAGEHVGLAFEAELGERGGLEQEAAPALRGQLEPTGGEDAQEVAV